MSKFQKYLQQLHHDVFLIDDGGKSSRTKDDYIVNAEEGTIVAFRLNFTSKQDLKLTKVISGKILENSQDSEVFVVETRNGLKYGVPYGAVVWVKTGNRWPKGVYDEMKQGSVEADGVKEAVDFDNDENSMTLEELLSLEEDEE